MAELIQVKNLRTSFFTPEGEVRAVDGVSFDIGEGKTLGLVGESGCGKSVTALSIMRLVPSPPGKIVGGEIYRGTELPATNTSPWPNLQAALRKLEALEADWDAYGAPPPNLLARTNANFVLDRAFHLGVVPTTVLPSAEGGVFIGFDGPAGRRANVECFNDGTGYAATVADTVAVWPVSMVDEAEIDATLQRASEHIAA